MAKQQKKILGEKEGEWSWHAPMGLEADSVGGTFLGYFWTNYVRNELDWCSRYHTNIEFSCAVAVMEKLVDGEKRKED